jgi:hypothetical protein
MTAMATGQVGGNAGQGGFLRILGLIYLIKLIRRRRGRRAARNAAVESRSRWQTGPAPARPGADLRSVHKPGSYDPRTCRS